MLVISIFKMNLAIIGSRTITDKHYQFMNLVLEMFIMVNNKPLKIISGGCNGADKYAENYAKINKIPTDIYYPDWSKYGKLAGPIRNKQIIDKSDFVIAFKDKDYSKGTDNSIKLAKDKKILIWIIDVIKKKIKLS